METNIESVSTGKNIILFSCGGARGLLASSEISARLVTQGQEETKRKIIFPPEAYKRNKGCARQYCPGLQGEEPVLRIQPAEEISRLMTWKDTHGLQRRCEDT